MTLVELIRKSNSGKVATAIHAIPATQARTVTVAFSAESVPVRPVAALMTTDTEAVIRAWLAHIEETDEIIIADVLERCRTCSDTLEYFLRRAEEVPFLDTEDDRVTCPECVSFINEKCYKPSEGRPWRTRPDLPRRCVRFKPRVDDLDQRSGKERWPSL